MEDGTKSSEIIPKPSKLNCIMPKRACSAYIFYTTTNAKKIAEGQGVKYTEAMKQCGANWTAMSEKEKKPYEKQNQDD